MTTKMRYGSVCSGIEAATVAWHSLEWAPAFFSEIEPFPSKVLAYRWPKVPNLGDFTTIKDTYGPIDLLVGGTPCQSFSIAGLRKGMDDPRGNLAFEFFQLASRLSARWFIWENVPGVLSINGGRTFGSILGTLAKLGYGFAYRVLDAQFFGVPQRRRRVFLVGYLGDWRRPAAVLFERASLQGNPTPSRTTRANIAGTIGEHVDKGEPNDATLKQNMPSSPIIFDTTQITSSKNWSHPKPGAPSHPLISKGHPPAIAFDPFVFVNAGGNTALGMSRPGVPTLTLSNGNPGNVVIPGAAVRRLTPRECERLQGFPDDYTLIPGSSDSSRYRAIGNSMAVPVMKWIGQRISDVEKYLP